MYILITNNPLVNKKYRCMDKIYLKNASLKDVLIQVRDEIHRGANLLTHPLTGGIKPDESPFKSILIQKRSESSLDLESLNIISSAIEVAEKFLRDSCVKKYNANIIKDFQTIDFAMIESGIKSLGGRDGKSL